jgi:Mlc titration factor MtfA (ptsG expression regulator)
MGFFKNRRRAKLRARPFPDAWRAIIDKNVPFAKRLSPEDRAHWEGDLQVFAFEKVFIGGGGLEITDEHRVTISASAVRLTLHLDLSLYDRLTEIIVHPTAYVRPETPSHRGERPQSGVLLGESQQWGVVVLAWDAVMRGLSAEKDGQDVVLHELAHVIDRADGAVDGAPPLRAREDMRPWAETMMRHYTALQEGDSKVLRDYGATNPAEFFAVATEAYFERPAKLKDKAPDLYEALRKFYGDPAGS